MSDAGSARQRRSRRQSSDGQPVQDFPDQRVDLLRLAHVLGPLSLKERHSEMLLFGAELFSLFLRQLTLVRFRLVLVVRNMSTVPSW
jgi:hypothetical protein